jgi:hypothetical protein
MRSSQVYRALDQVPNRFILCQTISQSARRIHVNGNPFEGTVTAVLNGIGDGLFRGEIGACSPRDDSHVAAQNGFWPHEMLFPLSYIQQWVQRPIQK